ncbi:MAG TPA: carboxylesterase/lipase family protein [Polyangiales bacterium]|nr:carboxylesterase/lipase family protein [Polyangiales bacterium]
MGCDEDEASGTQSETADTDAAADSGESTPDVHVPLATTTNGRVEGYVEDGVLVFKGIRYGADTATTRFAAPAKPARWDDVQSAKAFGNSCPQTPTGNPGGLFTSWAPDPAPALSEDCLFMNVWTRAVADGKKRPVMVWIHGGGFASGNGSARAYDGVRLVRRGDVVVMSLNHRLNLNGYLALDHYGPGFEDSGVAGLLDLVLALEWVRDNAAAFGGDAKNVTIFGESGGGAKVSTLLATESAKGLFHRAIVQSGAVLRLPDASVARAAADKVVKNLGLSAETIDRIKTLPEADIRRAFMGTGAASAPLIDGRTLTRDPFSPDAAPSGRDVPMMLGTNRTENALFAGPANEALFQLTWEALPAELAKDFPDQDVQAIIAGYRKLQPESSPSDIYFEATTDANYLAGHRLQAERKVALGGAPTWLYLFNWNTPVQDGKWRCPHALEIGFVFDNVAYSESMSGIGEEQSRVAEIMADTWLAFAKTGDPNNRRVPNWPRYDTAQRPVMVLDETPEMVHDPRGEQVALFGPEAGLQYGNRYAASN